MVKKNLQISLVLILIGSLIAGAVWLAAGRLPLFQSSNYISIFASDKALELYQANVLWLTPNTGVKQSFTAVYPGLNEVSVLWAYPEEMAQDATITFALKESCDASDSIRRAVTPLTEIEDGAFYSFTFTPLDGSAGQTYCYILKPDPAVVDKSIGVWASQYNVYAEGSAFYKAPPEPTPAARAAEEQVATVTQQNGGEYEVFLPLVVLAGKSESLPADFDTGFQLHYNGRPVAALAVFMNRLVEYKPYFWGNKAFYVLLFGFYIAGVFFLARVRSD